jgi:hypothetical protein
LVPLSNFRQRFEKAKIRERNQGSLFAILGIKGQIRRQQYKSIISNNCKTGSAAAALYKAG